MNLCCDILAIAFGSGYTEVLNRSKNSSIAFTLKTMTCRCFCLVQLLDDSVPSKYVEPLKTLYDIHLYRKGVVSILCTHCIERVHSKYSITFVYACTKLQACHAV